MSKKKLNYRILFTALIVMLLVSCGKKTEYTTAIPANASAIFSVDLKSLIKKSGIDDNKAQKGKLGDALKDGLNADAVQYMERILKNPSEIGISIADKIYFFVTKSERVGVVARVSNRSNLNKTFNLLQDEGLYIQHLKNSNGHEMIAINEKDFCCFDNGTFLLLIGPNEMESDDTQIEAEQYFVLGKNESVVSDKGFAKMQEKKADISAYFSMSLFPQEYAKMMMTTLPPGIKLDDMKMIASLNFENGKINFLTENYTENKAVKNLYDENNKLMAQINPDFFSYFPASTLYYVGANFKGEILNKVLGNNREFKNATGYLAQQGIELDKIFASIDGNMALGINSFSMMSMPVISFYVETNNDELIQALNKSFSGIVKKVNDNNYEMNLGREMKMYYGMKDKLFYFTTDNTIASNPGKKISNSILDSNLANNAKGSMSYVLINLKEIINLPFLAMALGDSQEAAIARMALSMFEYVDMSAKKPQVMEMNLVMSNSNENALKQLISFGEQFAD